MGKDKKKFAMVMGRLDLQKEVITLVVPKAGHYNLPGCRGTDGFCADCCKFRGVEGGEGCKYRDWWKYALPSNRQLINDLVNQATMPWENKRVVVDVSLAEEPPSRYFFNGPRKYNVRVRVSASMRMELLIRSLPNSQIPSSQSTPLQPTPGRQRKEKSPPRHLHSSSCGHFLLLSDLISSAISHRKEDRSLAITLQGTVKEFLGTCVSMKLQLAVPLHLLLEASSPSSSSSASSISLPSPTLPCTPTSSSSSTSRLLPPKKMETSLPPIDPPVTEVDVDGVIHKLLPPSKVTELIKNNLLKIEE